MKCSSFFTENALIPHNKLGYKNGDSCINHLLCITHDIYQQVNDGYFCLDMSKPFHKVWDEGLLYKLKQSGSILGKLSNVLQSIFCVRGNKELF